MTEVHAAIQREHPEPTAEVTPIPLWLTAVCGVAILGAGVYLGAFHGGFRADVFDAADSSARMFVNETAKTDGGPSAAQAGPTLVEQGKSAYANCQPCHQPTGQGVSGQFPTLLGTEYVASEKRIVAILLKGIQGVIKVGGAQYNGAMPAWEKTLSDKKIAAVATYVRSAWSNKFPEVTEAKVAAGRKEFAAQVQPWTEAQLLAIPGNAAFPDAGAPDGAASAAPAITASGLGSTVTTGVPAPVNTSPSPATAAAPAGDSTAVAAGAPTSKMMALGKAQFMTCMPCHQPTGLGLPPVFPPLAKSEYVLGDPKRMVAIVLKGIAGAITVNGAPYNNVMPGQGMTMKDDQIAAATTYVRNSFGNSAPAISAELVAQVRKQHAARMAPWTEVELKAYGSQGNAAPVTGPAQAAANIVPTAPNVQSAMPASDTTPNPVLPAAPASVPSESSFPAPTPQASESKVEPAAPAGVASPPVPAPAAAREP